MSEVKLLKEKLAKLLANKGVSPFILGNNISESNYDEISLYKRDGLIIVDMYCRDLDTNQPLQFRYTYNGQEVLLKKEMTISGRKSLIWSRDAEIASLVKQIQELSVTV